VPITGCVTITGQPPYLLVAFSPSRCPLTGFAFNYHLVRAALIGGRAWEPSPEKFKLLLKWCILLHYEGHQRTFRDTIINTQRTMSNPI